jgi:hypothetical protein
MGFLSDLFGGFKPKKYPQGSKENPWVCELPPSSALAKMREAAAQVMVQMRKRSPEFENNESDLDGLIAEELKMSLLRSLYGEEGKTWKCGNRLYFENSIQTQEIIFTDGSPTTIFYSDFSKFGAFEELHVAPKLVEGWIHFLSAEGEGKSRSLLDTKSLTFQRTSDQNSESIELFALMPNIEDLNRLVIIYHGHWKAAQEHLRRFADSSQDDYSKQFEQICQRLTSDKEIPIYYFQVLRKGLK